MHGVGTARLTSGRTPATISRAHATANLAQSAHRAIDATPSPATSSLLALVPWSLLAFRPMVHPRPMVQPCTMGETLANTCQYGIYIPSSPCHGATFAHRHSVPPAPPPLPFLPWCFGPSLPSVPWCIPAPWCNLAPWVQHLQALANTLFTYRHPRVMVQLSHIDTACPRPRRLFPSCLGALVPPCLPSPPMVHPRPMVQPCTMGATLASTCQYAIYRPSSPRHGAAFAIAPSVPPSSGPNPIHLPPEPSRNHGVGDDPDAAGPPIRARTFPGLPLAIPRPSRHHAPT
jgi:hypothetical protein